MTNDELRALADALEPMAKAPRFEDFDVPAFCVWVRAQADAQPVAAVPAGWKPVPVEPTPEMLSAVGMMDGYDWHAPGCSPDADHANWYSAMIAAAPAAPQTEPKREPLTQAAHDVLAERRRQIEAEGWTPEHDDEHVLGEIAALAAFYAVPDGVRDWDFSSTGYGDTLAEALLPNGWTAKAGEDRRRDLVKAGALILAEIERIDRMGGGDAE